MYTYTYMYTCTYTYPWIPSDGQGRCKGQLAQMLMCGFGSATGVTVALHSLKWHSTYWSGTPLTVEKWSTQWQCTQWSGTPLTVEKWGEVALHSLRWQHRLHQLGSTMRANCFCLVSRRSVSVCVCAGCACLNEGLCLCVFACVPEVTRGREAGVRTEEQGYLQHRCHASGWYIKVVAIHYTGQPLIFRQFLQFSS